MGYIPDSKIIQKFETATTNAAHPEIAPRLLTFGYTQEVRQADLALLPPVSEARKVQQEEQADARSATVADEQVKTTGRAAFVQLHRLIRLADLRSPQVELKRVLGIGRLPDAEAAFSDYATGLLDRIESQPEAMTALGYFGFTAERVAELRDLLDSIRQANITQQQEIGEAQQATAVYRERMDQLRLAYSILRGLAREALADDPQLLALMGMGRV